MRILTSLADGHYFCGLAALLNSILHHSEDFFDHVVVGYRGELPKWLPQAEASQHGKVVKLSDRLKMELIPMDAELHMVHEKPRWFQRLTNSLFPEADEFFFFDSDITVLNRTSFFGEWVSQGVALCEDVNGDMPVDHPIRKQWAELASNAGLEILHHRSRYYNSGFIGWRRETACFIDDWVRCFEILAPRSGDMKKFRTADRTFPVLSANQDSLNLATMVTSAPISTIGPEAMGFSWGLRLMAHPLGPDGKPWNKHYLREFLAGKPPTRADLSFWEFVHGGPLCPFPESTARQKLHTCKLLRMLGRFYAGGLS